MTTELVMVSEVEEEVLTSDTSRRAFSIVSLAFKDDNKWRLYDGNTQISARISDEDFLRRVNASQISFSKGDVLICDVEVVQKQTKEGIKNEYVVQRVIDHKHAPRQIPLNFPPVNQPKKP